jgi:SAM-dependent methyltransferase
MDNSSRNNLQKWRNLNLYYYQDIENFHKVVVQKESKILEVGASLGYLLNSLQPIYGLGLEQDSKVVDQAQILFPHLDFIASDPESFRSSDMLFDYILLANMISYLTDITQTLKNLHQSCQPSTRLILTFHNPGWEIILKFASLIGQRSPLSQLNWLSYDDVENLLYLCQFEVVYHSKRLLLPKQVPLLSWFCNHVLAPLPLFNQFCLNEYIIARPIIHISNTLSCSVIIPARNESGNIEACIANMPQFGANTEIIFVEGGSSDGTWEEILRVQQKYCDRFNIKSSRQSGQGKNCNRRCIDNFGRRFDGTT